MTPNQLLTHFDNNKSSISKVLGCSRATIGNWLKKKSIPYQWQVTIEVLTKKKLRAEVK